MIDFDRFEAITAYVAKEVVRQTFGRFPGTPRSLLSEIETIGQELAIAAL